MGAKYEVWMVMQDGNAAPMRVSTENANEYLDHFDSETAATGYCDRLIDRGWRGHSVAALVMKRTDRQPAERVYARQIEAVREYPYP